jgi:hypothetical protein
VIVGVIATSTACSIFVPTDPDDFPRDAAADATGDSFDGTFGDSSDANGSIDAPSDGDATDSDASIPDVEVGPSEAAVDGDTVAYDEAGCPTGRGPAMVRIDAANGSYCIDTTEVTIGQFNAYVAADPSPEFPAVCAPFGADNPSEYHGAPTDDYPMHEEINYCQAWAFCHWANRRLCGKIGGGSAVDGSDTDLLRLNEWHYACANGTMADTFPYGANEDDFDASVCNSDNDEGYDADLSGFTAVGAYANCHGMGAPFDRVFDMSGNAGEIDDYILITVDGGTVEGGDYEFRFNGGISRYDGIGWQCTSGNATWLHLRVDTGDQFGIRCCADVESK